MNSADDICARIELYSCSDGGHDDAVGANIYELASEASDEIRSLRKRLEHAEQFMHVISPAVGMARLWLASNEKSRADIKEQLDAACDEMDAWELARNPRLAELCPYIEDAAERHAARSSLQANNVSGSSK